MIDLSTIDWTFLTSINLFQIGVVIVALWLVGKVLVKFWPWLRKVMDFTTVLSNLAEFIARTDATLAEQNKVIERLRKQVENGHKTNLRDELTTTLELATETRDLVERHGVLIADVSDKLANDHKRITNLEDTHPKEKP